VSQPAIDVQTILSGELMRAARSGWMLEDRGDSWARLRRDRSFRSPQRIMIQVSPLGEVTVGPAQQPPLSGHHSPSWNRKWVWAVGGVFALFVLGGLINSGNGDNRATSTASTASTATTTPSFGTFATMASAEDDVIVSKCVTSGDVIGMADIAVRITNSTSRVQSYWVTVSVNDAAGNRLTEANGASNSIRPGQAATAKLLAPAVDGASSCAVANVTRIPQ
jgi:hypothetical protein